MALGCYEPDLRDARKYVLVGTRCPRGRPQLPGASGVDRRGSTTGLLDSDRRMVSNVKGWKRGL